jgi:hypothetical protein
LDFCVGDLRGPHRVNRRFLRCGFHFPPARWAGGPHRRGLAPVDYSPASFGTGPVGSTAQTDHSLLQPDILAVPSCSAALIWSSGNQQINSISFPLAASINCSGTDTQMRLTAPHGPGQRHMFDNRYSLQHCNGHWFRAQENQHTVTGLPFALFIYASGNSK